MNQPLSIEQAIARARSYMKDCNNETYVLTSAERLENYFDHEHVWHLWFTPPRFTGIVPHGMPVVVDAISGETWVPPYC